MPTRPVEATHEADHDNASPREAANPAVGKVESPAKEDMQGAAAAPRYTNGDDEFTGDQDIDTAGTAHDDLSPTKSL